MTDIHDWTRFTRQIFIKADIEQVFKAWTTEAGIISWFIAEANYTSADGRERGAEETIEAGDSYFWRWHQDISTSGEILLIEQGSLLQFTFGKRADDPDEKIIVTVKFTELDGETLLELHQENLPTSDTDKLYWYTGCNMGWSFFMTNLKAMLEFGGDLREYDSERAYASRAISL